MFAGSLFVTFWAAPLAAEMITFAIAVILTKKHNCSISRFFRRIKKEASDKLSNLSKAFL